MAYSMYCLSLSQRDHLQRAPSISRVTNLERNVLSRILGMGFGIREIWDIGPWIWAIWDMGFAILLYGSMQKTRDPTFKQKGSVREHPRFGCIFCKQI